MQRFPTFHRNSSTTGVLTAREQLSEILCRHYTAAVAQERRRKSKGKAEGLSSRQTRRETKMPSSKGNPTDPELREQVKEEVKAEGKGKAHLINFYLFPSAVNDEGNISIHSSIYPLRISLACHGSAFLHFILPLAWHSPSLSNPFRAKKGPI
jgi:hypothetical protein